MATTVESYLDESPLLGEIYREEYLPESDGKPMAETDTHRRYMLDVLDALDEHYRDDPWTYVTGNIFLYYPDETGKLHAVSPDIFVVHGVEKKDRRIYNMNVENKGPEVVIELTSSSTKMEDLGNKRFLYASLGVKEYFLFDPFGEAVRPLLRGFRLEDGDYMPIVGTRLHSQVLGLELRLEESNLRLYNPKTREYLLTREETHQARRAAEAARQAAEAKAAQEAAARQAAEAKAMQEAAARQAAEAKAAQEAAARQAAEAKAAQEAAARQTAEAKAVQEAAARQTAEAKAVQEAAARQAAEAELARLREELAKRNGQKN